MTRSKLPRVEKYYFVKFFICFIIKFNCYICIMIKPLYDRVIVKLITESDSGSDLVIPERKVEGFQNARVISVGHFNPDTKKPLVVSIGDIVMFGANSGIPITENGEELLVIREKHIEVIL